MNTFLPLTIGSFVRIISLVVVMGFAPFAAGAGTLNYQAAYDSGLKGDWTLNLWQNIEGDLVVQTNGAAPGRAGSALDVRFNAPGGYGAFGLLESKANWDLQYKYLNEFQTIEFEFYIDRDSADVSELYFILEDAYLSDEPKLVDLIPEWPSLSAAERTGQWFHVRVGLPEIHPTMPRFAGFVIFNNSTGHPHIRLADVKLGWAPDTTAPVVFVTDVRPSLTYDSLRLTFETDEASVYRVEYGVNDYSLSVEGGYDDWAFSHGVTLPELQPGSTVQYRITATGHRVDPSSSTSAGSYTGSFRLPSVPTHAPTIDELVVTNVTASRAEVRWVTQRPATVALTYQRAGGAMLSRSLSDYRSSGSAVLDLLEPSQTYLLHLAVTDAFGLFSARETSFSTPAASAPTVTISIQPTEEHPISPWIYGINDYQAVVDPPEHLTLNRSGGNRWTAYNWENNASNAGSDWGPFQSDDYLLWVIDPTLANDGPGEAVRLRVAADRERAMASLITVPMQGYAALDKNGVLIDLDDPNALAEHFREVVYHKDTAFADPPALTDPYVYVDEFIWALRGKFPGDIYSDPATPTFVSLDNEPDLWGYTHREVQKSPIGPDEYLGKTIALATALKRVDPALVLFGPAHYGFAGIQSFQEQPGFSLTQWFTDKYLSALRTASEAAGRRLLDVYDVHWYSSARWPEAGPYDSVTSLQSNDLTESQIQAIVQSPRSLWDPTFDEDSWITRSFFNGPILLLPRLKEKIETNWPGTGLAITEYENGGGAHIAGAIAQADNLGIFGQQALFAANLWPLSTNYPFIKAAFKMYRDYDGDGGRFGDQSLNASSSATDKVAAYVSRESARSGRYVIVALNRSFAAQDVRFDGLTFAGQARLFRLMDENPQPSFVGEVPVQLPAWVVTLPPLSVTTIELTAGGPHLKVGRASGSGNLKLVLKGVPGKTYSIVSSVDLKEWQSVETVTLNSSEAEMSLSASSKTAFYRLIQIP
ncbi:MAG: glycoside hydrolase family 44 protein [Verrucomicrobiota bacterium]